MMVRRYSDISRLAILCTTLVVSGCAFRQHDQSVSTWFPRFAPSAPTAQFAENPFGVTDAALAVGDTMDPNEQLNLLRAGNIGWMRLVVDWSVAGVDSTHYDSRYLAQFDQVVSRAGQVGVNVCLGLSYAPDWVHPGYAGRRYAPYPVRYRAWTGFVTDMVRRYSALGVHCYSIWNEPNSARSFVPVTTTDDTWWTEYEALLLMASGAIRTVDPGARIAAYELAYRPSSKLEGQLALSLDRVGTAIDVVAVHYSTAIPGDIYDAMVTRIPALNPVIRRHGVELWLTETSGLHDIASAESVPKHDWVQALMMDFSHRPDTSSWNKTFVSPVSIAAMRAVATRYGAFRQDR